MPNSEIQPVLIKDGDPKSEKRAKKIDDLIKSEEPTEDNELNFLDILKKNEKI